MFAEVCPGLTWTEFIFFSVADPVSAVFWMRYENDVDIVMLLVVAQQCSS